MTNDIKALYIALVTDKTSRAEIVEINMATHKVAVIKASTLANRCGDIYTVGDDVYANLPVYQVFIKVPSKNAGRIHNLYPQIDDFRKLLQGG